MWIRNRFGRPHVPAKEFSSDLIFRTAGDVRIVSWNVQGLKGGADKVATALLDERPSLIALQEYCSGAKAAVVESRLGVYGLVPFKRPARERFFRTIIFAPSTARLAPSPPELPENDPFWVDVRFDGIGISAAHIAIPAYAELRKMHWQVAFAIVASNANTPHLLIGDLNTTRRDIDQVGASIPGDHYLRELEAAGWSEAWRTVHPEPEPREYSWYHELGSGFRFDQAWLSPTLTPHLVGTYMNHGVREQRLSDHSMLVVDIDV